MTDLLDPVTLRRAVAAIRAGRTNPLAVVRLYEGQPPWRLLETRQTRDRVERYDWGHRCVPQRPDADPAWFIVDNSDDWRTVWGRWRDVGRA